MSTTNVFQQTEKMLAEKGFNITDRNTEKPWGGYFVIDEQQSDRFIREFFPTLSPEDFRGFDKLSPKFLMVAPGKRLSWQYHHRRSEVWRLIDGLAGVVKSPTDEETAVHELETGELVRLECGERHRLVGLPGGWGVLAEIWQHEDPDNPSNEDDIVRVQDDFGR